VIDNPFRIVKHWIEYWGLNAAIVSIGTLYGISAGPGDPELLTMKAVRLLQHSPVVAYPAGIRDKPGFAEHIIAQWLSPAQTRLSLSFPYVQDQVGWKNAWKFAPEPVWQN